MNWKKETPKFSSTQILFLLRSHQLHVNLSCLNLFLVNPSKTSIFTKIYKQNYKHVNLNMSSCFSSTETWRNFSAGLKNLSHKNKSLAFYFSIKTFFFYFNSQTRTFFIAQVFQVWFSFLSFSPVKSFLNLLFTR